MAIIFELGEEFWIETFIATVTGVTQNVTESGTNTPLERPGFLVGWTAVTATGMPRNPLVQLADQSNANLTIGAHITGIVARMRPTSASPVGDVQIIACLFMRGRHVLT